MTTAAVAKTGVEAVIEGLGNFESGFNKMNELVGGFGDTAERSERKFRPFRSLLDAVGESLRRITEFVIAGIILRGLEKIVGVIRDMVAGVIDAGIEFQKLQIRLEQFVAQDIFATGDVEDFAQALEMAVPQAEDLFFWIQKLALQTPFDIQDVADAMTMARAWGFNADEAKRLTEQVIDFTAGMGFTSEEMDRVIKALGQMRSLGRVAGQELLQLANAGVPVAEIMEEIRLELGLTIDEFDDLRREGGVSAQMFFDKWDELVSTKFQGAAERMSRTLEGVRGNIKDLIQGVLGFNVVKPILDSVAAKLADIIDALTTGERGDKLLAITKQIGDVLAGVMDSIFGILEPEDIADKILRAIDLIKGKIIGLIEIWDTPPSKTGFFNQLAATFGLFGINPDFAATLEGIYEKIRGFIDGIRSLFSEEPILGSEEHPIPKFFNNLRGAIDNFKTFWEENGSAIMGAFSSILESVTGGAEITGESILDIISGAIFNLANMMVEKGPQISETIQDIADFIREDFLPAWDKITTWVVENKETILKFMAGFAIAWTILKVAMIIIIPIVIALLGAIVLLSSPIIALLTLIPILIGLIVAFGDSVGTAFSQLWEIIKFKAQQIKDNFGQFMKDAAKNAIDGFISSLINGFISTWNIVSPWLQWLVDQIKNLLGISSPSTLFAEFGEAINEGLAKGIIDSIQLPKAAMEATVQHVVSAGSMGVMGSQTTNNTVTNNFNMNVNSQARREPIIQDFNTMQAIVGGFS